MKAYLNRFQTFLICFGLSSITFLFTAIAFYPANMSPDSVEQWRQGSVWAFDTLHPYAFSMLLGAANKFFGSPFAIVLLQVFVASLLISLFLQLLSTLGVSKKVIYLTLISILLFLPISLYGTFIWKDILYTYAILAVSYIFVSNALAKRSLRNNDLALVATLLLVIIAFRHNGVIYVLVLPAVLYLYKLLNIKRSIALFIFGTIFFLLFEFVFPQTFAISEGGKLLKEIPKSKMISLAYSRNKLSAVDKAFLLNIANDDIWSNYICENDFELFWNKGFKREYIKNNQEKWVQIYKDTIRTNPNLLIYDRGCMAINLLAGRNPFYLGIFPNELGLKQDNNYLNIFTKEFYSKTAKIPLRFIFWTPAIFVLFYIVTMAYAVFNKYWITAGYIFINVINTLLIFALVTSAEYRYLYSMILAAFFVPGLLIVEKIVNNRKSDKILNKK